MIDIRNPLPCEEAVERLVQCCRNSRDPVAEAIPSACAELTALCASHPDPNDPDRAPGEEQGPRPALPFLQYRLNVACILAESLKAEADLVIASLLGPGIKARLFYRNTLEPRIGAQAFERVSSILRPVSNSFPDLCAAADAVDELLWERALDQQYQELLRKVRKNRTPQTYYIKQAYALARDSHRGSFRASGEPSLAQPLAVAHVLADRNAGSELIAAALLQEVGALSPEGPEYARRRIRQISTQVARCAEAADAVDRACASWLKDRAAPGEAYRQPDKPDTERAAVNRLLSLAGQSEALIHAVYIKAAVCCCSLQSPEGMPPDELRSRLDALDTFYLPVFRAFGINDFVPTLEDQLWRAGNPAAYRRVSSALNRLLRVNRRNLSETWALLASVVNGALAQKCEELHVPIFYTELIKEQILPCQVYRQLKDAEPEDPAPAVNKYSTPLLRLSLVESGQGGSGDLALFASVFLKALEEATEDLRCVITGISAESISDGRPERKRIVLELENEMASRIVLSLYEQDDYFYYKKGSSEGVVKPDRDEDLELLAGSIRVHRADDSVIHLPKGATALDFAFAIHEDVGMYAVKASINDSELLERLLFSTLTDGDKVVIQHLADRAGGYGVPQIRIDWLNHVTTGSARKRITRWLQDKYERVSAEEGEGR